MNITLELNKIIISNIYFLEKKKNIIMDGNFTKILYSNSWFTMNGLYVLFPIEVLSIDKNINKSILKFNPYQNNNITIIQEFVKLEQQILEYYVKLNNCKSKLSTNLLRQLYLGTLKIYKDFNLTDNKNLHYMIKISGVWETHENVGITYKVIEVNI